METLKVIQERKSIRSYTSQKLSKELIEDILNCGRLAPSAKNRQPWYFVVVEKNIKNKIADLMLEYVENNIQNLKSSVETTAKIIKEVPILVLILKDKNNDTIISDTLSIGARVENMCLRATDLGIGSLWIRDVIYVEDEIIKILNHENRELSCALTLGYTNQIPRQRPKKELEDIVEWHNE